MRKLATCALAALVTACGANTTTTPVKSASYTAAEAAETKPTIEAAPLPKSQAECAMLADSSESDAALGGFQATRDAVGILAKHGVIRPRGETDRAIEEATNKVLHGFTYVEQGRQFCSRERYTAGLQEIGRAMQDMRTALNKRLQNKAQ